MAGDLAGSVDHPAVFGVVSDPQRSFTLKNMAEGIITQKKYGNNYSTNHSGDNYSSKTRLVGKALDKRSF